MIQSNHLPTAMSSITATRDAFDKVSTISTAFQAPATSAGGLSNALASAVPITQALPSAMT